MAAHLADPPSLTTLCTSLPPQQGISHLMERVLSLERSLHQLQSDQKNRDEWNSEHVHHIEKQREIVSPRSPRCAYSTVLMKPVPCAFQMPLHYPKYKKADYESMPEWKLDRLLEEYGLPVRGGLHEKREYAMGCFLWRDQRD